MILIRGLGKPYIARNLFRDCKSAAIPEDDYAAVWFALADYILEKINSAQPEVLLNIFLLIQATHPPSPAQNPTHDIYALAVVLLHAYCCNPPGRYCRRVRQILQVPNREQTVATCTRIQRKTQLCWNLPRGSGRAYRRAELCVTRLVIEEAA